MKRLAFTLIELLVVVAIMLIMVVFAVPAFNRYGERSRLESKAEEIKVMIEKSKAYSESPEKGSNGEIIIIGKGDLNQNMPPSMNVYEIKFINPDICSNFYCLDINNDKIISRENVDLSLPSKYFSIQAITYYESNGNIRSSNNNTIELDFVTPDIVKIAESGDPPPSKVTFQLYSSKVTDYYQEIYVNANPFYVRTELKSN